MNLNKPKFDTYKIYGRLIIDRRKTEFATNFYCEEKLWDKEKGRAKKNMVINDELSEIENNLNRIRRKLLDDGKPLSSRSIIAIYKGDKKTQRFLVEYMDEHIKEIREKKEHAINTVNHYSASKKIYQDFIKSAYKKSDFPIKEMNYDFVKAFDHYLMTKHTDRHGNNIKRNTANKHHSRLRTMLHKAHNEALILENPYTRFQLRNKPTNRSFLTSDEINRIIKLNFENNQVLDRVRDFFLFSCYTSLRFSDAYNLKMTDIIETSNSKKIISIEMDKTKEMVYVPLIAEAMELIDKYKDEDSRIVSNYVLPRYSNQKVNLFLKHIGTLAEIEKDLTHHVARHTFATVALNNGIPLDVVQKILGHSSIRTTQIYAKMLTSTLEKEMEKFKL
ncbi:MAG: tyrosine-type recombinase/integrase [Salinivirgaceae bacterium]